jgi:hypothetical protein
MPESFPGEMETPLVDAAGYGQRMDVRSFTPPPQRKLLSHGACAKAFDGRGLRRRCLVSHSLVSQQPRSQPLRPSLHSASAVREPATGGSGSQGLLPGGQAREGLLHARRHVDALARHALHEGRLRHVSHPTQRSLCPLAVQAATVAASHPHMVQTA